MREINNAVLFGLFMTSVLGRTSANFELNLVSGLLLSLFATPISAEAKNIGKEILTILPNCLIKVR